MNNSRFRYSYTPAGSAVRFSGLQKGNLILDDPLEDELISEIEGLQFDRLVLGRAKWPDLSFFIDRPIQELLVYGQEIDWPSINKFKQLKAIHLVGETRPKIEKPLLNQLDQWGQSH